MSGKSPKGDRKEPEFRAWLEQQGIGRIPSGDRKWAYPGEPLREHLLAVARVGRELFPREAELFERRAGLPWEYVAYFHDVGKAHVVYQGGEAASYMCHEVYSAAVAYTALRERGELGARAVATAALLHHHAMERADACASMFRRLELPPRFEPADGLGELLRELLGREVRLPRCPTRGAWSRKWQATGGHTPWRR